MARSESEKNAESEARSGASGPASTLPPAGPSLAVFVLTLCAAAAVFLYFLSREQPRPGWLALAAGLVLAYFESRSLPGLKERTALRRSRAEARRLVKSVRGAIRKQKNWAGSGAIDSLSAAIDSLDQAMDGYDAGEIDRAAKSLDELAEKHLTRKAPAREYAEQIGGAVLVALLLRAFAYEAFKIPSSSMVPTLLVGDHLFVNKFVYGLRVPFTVKKIWAQVPERGDIVVFNRPGDESGDDVIKRVIGLPGDRITVRDRHIWVNGEPLETSPLPPVEINEHGDSADDTSKGPFVTHYPFKETLGEHSYVAFARGRWPAVVPGTEGEWVVEPGHVFVMGDNRDNSQDSRFPRWEGGFGQVPISYIKGRADVIWLSIGGPHGLRFSRMPKLIE